MFILQLYSYEQYEYDTTTVLAVSDTREALVEFAQSTKMWDRVYDQQWEVSSDGTASLEYLKGTYIGTDDVYTAEGFIIEPVQRV